MEYVGEILTLEEAKNNPETYQFEMDYCGPKLKQFVVDALKFGGVIFKTLIVC